MGASYTGHGGQERSAPRRPLKSVLNTAQSQLPFFTWFGDSETHSPPKREISWKNSYSSKEVAERFTEARPRACPAPGPPMPTRQLTSPRRGRAGWAGAQGWARGALRPSACCWDRHPAFILPLLSFQLILEKSAYAISFRTVSLNILSKCARRREQ